MREEEYQALRRDYGLCVKCFKKGIYKHADVVTKVDNKKGIVKDNLISLCNECIKSWEIVNRKLESAKTPKKKKKDAITDNVQ